MDAVEEFFAEVKGRGYDPRLRRATGTIRYDLENNGRGLDSWAVTVTKGDLEVSHRKAKADTVVTTDRRFFAKILSGRANAMASAMRGLVTVEGDPQLAVLSIRLFGGSVNA